MKDYRFLFEKYLLRKHPYSRIWESESIKKVKAVRGELFVDVGAFKLSYSRRLAHNFKRIIAFEPNVNIQNMDYPKNISIRRTALSNHQGRELFYCYNNRGSDSLIHDFDYAIRGAQMGPMKQVIHCFPVQIDTYDHAVGTVADLVKIDVEGAEFQVLEGMATYPPRRILVESHDYRRDNELVKRLENRDYRVTQIDGNHWWGEL